MTKYRNRKTTVCGITFDSEKEAGRYLHLKALLETGKIRNLKLQPEFTIQEAFRTVNGEPVRAIRYRADFSYERETAPDCNGFRTKEYEIKKKLMASSGIMVIEI